MKSLMERLNEALDNNVIGAKEMNDLLKKGVKDFSGYVYKGETFDCNGKGITHLPEMPHTKDVFCNNNNLTTLPELKNCTFLQCSGNTIIELPALPHCTTLDCSDNKLTKINTLPQCVELNCQDNNIVTISLLPKCKELNCGGNRKLTSLPKMPALEELSIWKTGIKRGEHSQGADVSVVY